MSEEKILKEIGQRLVNIRKHLGMLQKDFAQKMEISNASLSEIEAGNNKPRFELVYNLTKKYKVNIYYLLHGEGDMFMPQDFAAAAKERKYGPETAEWLKKFLYYFNESQILRYEMMAGFTRFMVEYRDSVEKEVAENRDRAEEQQPPEP